MGTRGCSDSQKGQAVLDGVPPMGVATLNVRKRVLLTLELEGKELGP